MDSNQADIRRRLARLGAGQRKRNFAARGEADCVSPMVAQDADGLSRLQQLQERQTPAGLAGVVERVFPLATRHGLTLLGDVLQLRPHLTGMITGILANEIDPERLVFLDTETTGLAGGAGTLAFLVGVGFVRGEEFILRQYFLRTPAEEPAMLAALTEDMAADPVLVTYNGKTFDIPLLETRALVGLRRRWKLSSNPQIDLLHLTRRMWRQALPDCRLGTVEAHVLGVERTGTDIPGSEIPGIYLDYLKTGDTTQVDRVLYHNEVDILSLVALLVQIIGRFTRRDLAGLDEAELLALGRWYERAGERAPAEEAFQQALHGVRVDVKVEALQRLSLQFKRAGLYEQAQEYWMEWSRLDPADPEPRLELAKYYEWRQKDWLKAQKWAGDALVCLTHWPPGPKRARSWAEIEHRQKRLAEKATQAQSDGPG